MNKNTFKKTIVILLPLFLAATAFVLFMDSTSPSNPEPEPADITDQAAAEQQNESEEESEQPESSEAQDTDELKIQDLQEGEGKEVKKGDTVLVHYRGTLLDGTEFDNSYDRGEPYEVTIGESAVIEGWHQGLPGMKVGGKRKLTIPSELGYGETGSGSIPPNAALVFEIELVEVVK